MDPNMRAATENEGQGSNVHVYVDHEMPTSPRNSLKLRNLTFLRL